MKRRFRNTHSYQFRNETIAAILGLSLSDLEAHGLHTGKRAREYAEKEARGETRKQIAERHYEEYKKMADQGIPRRKIAELLGLSIETIKKYRARRYRSGD